MSVKKETPSNCKFRRCHWNFLSPGENSQECIGCDGNKKENWKPRPAREELEVKHA